MRREEGGPSREEDGGVRRKVGKGGEEGLDEFRGGEGEDD